jgi:kynurenine formamidase
MRPDHPRTDDQSGSDRQQGVYLLALPLNVSEADGSWVRAVAFVPND